MSDEETSANRAPNFANLDHSEERDGADVGSDMSFEIEIDVTELGLMATGDGAGTGDSHALSHGSTEFQGSGPGDGGECSDGDGAGADDRDGGQMHLTGLENSASAESNVVKMAYYDIQEEHEVEFMEENSDEEEEPEVCVHPNGASSVQNIFKDTKSLEEWLASETSALPRPRWKVISGLRDRQLGSSPRFVYDACGARAFVQRFCLQYSLEGHTRRVNTVHFNQRGTLLASGSDDVHVIVWDWVHRKPLLNFPSGHQSDVLQAKFLPNCDDSTLVLCGSDGQVRVAHLCAVPSTITEHLVRHRGASHKCALEPDSPFKFLTCGEDGVVFSIDLRQSPPASQLLVAKENDTNVGLYTIYMNPAKIYQFAVGGEDQYVRIYDQRKIDDRENNGVLKKFCPHHLVHREYPPFITCLVYSHDGTELLASYNDDDIYLFNSSDDDGAQYLKRYKGHRNYATVKGVNFYGPRSEFVASGSDCGHIYIWEKSSCQIVQFLEADEGGTINSIDPHPNLPVMASSGLDHEVKIWAPTAEAPTKLAGIRDFLQINRWKQDDFTMQCTPLYNSHMFWPSTDHMTHPFWLPWNSPTFPANNESTDFPDSSSSSEEERKSRRNLSP
uniref:DDB1- and CUL4-associated factor 8-like n=1 Tax=Jaculus jaculus TaxID=51337 RepID=UPI001E1B4663|nr:DDB1- and CUL4-associated factor 8-like [Jaculus jaculus]